MKFFIDENLPGVALTGPLAALFRNHEFSSCTQEDLSGTLDIPLFGELSGRGFDAIITKDTGQVGQNDEERRALHDLNIHWVGVKEPAAKGLQLLATWNANITAAMPHIIEMIGDNSGPPSWFSVKGVGVEATQRLKTGPLWRPDWSS